MKIKTSLYFQEAMLAVNSVISFVYYQRFPDKVPTHWDIHNKVDQYGSKLVPVLMGPALILFGIVLTFALPKLSPKKYEISKFEETFALAMILVSGLFMFLSVTILQATSGQHPDIGRTMVAGIFLFFAFLGNILGKIQQNFFMGIRTPWTLASAPVWDATHRLGGRVFFVGGIIGAILAVCGLPMMVSVVLLLAIALYPVIASYFIYKRIG